MASRQPLHDTDTDRPSNDPEADLPLDEPRAVPDEGEAPAYGTSTPEAGRSSPDTGSPEIGQPPDYGAGRPETGYPTSTT
jgi:hypothetical protein